MRSLPTTPPDDGPAAPDSARGAGPAAAIRCPSCGRPAVALFCPVHPVPGEHPEHRDRPLVCPDCCPRPADETKT